MSEAIIAGSLATATLADFNCAKLYIGAASWVGERGDPDEIKIIYERVDGGFDSFTLAQLRECTWWRLGDPDQVICIESLMHPAPERARSHLADVVDTHAEQLERRKWLIRAEQAEARARMAVA